MTYDELSEFAMEIIANSGMARSCYIEAVRLAKNKEFEKANEKIKEGEKYYFEAHEAQNKLIFAEASGEEKIQVNILIVHAQDHLTMALMTKDNSKEFIELYKALYEKGGN
ncbi:PTS lactose/cellobiose transporter subunit IIA [Oceanivirga miroungae]|uniref:PTS system lactose/cellobiose-specific transporter subunit IIA n=1 Tax=Oceanivirga miroungae TaxID=1130046 RepID=A0A6I8M5H8_9FUSO|nr:PTS lactose/cellobiose transporter subunit IIA [Oceanivirga miroungae]VWL85189.1 PTS system lactose/cellobiose-specific transporter subunit IIA [Oceanivirga miroungae]